MKTLKQMSRATTIGALLVFGSVQAGTGDGAAVSAEPSLVGTWQFVMTVRNDAPDCATSEPITFGPNPFPALVSFHEGGTLNEFASRAPPSTRTTGFGSWKKMGKLQYRERHTFMEFDANGFLWRTMVIRSRIKLGTHGNKYQAVGRLALTDISGNVINLCATFDGNRFTP